MYAILSVAVAVESNSPAYSRDLFPTWDTISGNCDTRETVLKRDGTGVVTDSSCASTSGTWICKFPSLRFPTEYYMTGIL